MIIILFIIAYLIVYKLIIHIFREGKTEQELLDDYYSCLGEIHMEKRKYEDE